MTVIAAWLSTREHTHAQVNATLSRGGDSTTHTHTQRREKEALNECTVAFLFHSTFFSLFVLVRYVLVEDK